MKIETIGTPAPELIADPNLACEYPPLAVRLNEQGAVKLQVHVLADGSVSDVKLLQAHRFSRINDGALQLAKTRLRISPAQENGNAGRI